MTIQHYWIPGYEETYSISKCGTIYSHSRLNARGRLIKGKYIHPREDKDGYIRITLRKNNRPKNMAVHQLLAMTFLPNKDRLPEINHINKDRQDNSLDNLEWCTRQQNVEHQFKTKGKAK